MTDDRQTDKQTVKRNKQSGKTHAQRQPQSHTRTHRETKKNTHTQKGTRQNENTDTDMKKIDAWTGPSTGALTWRRVSKPEPLEPVSTDIDCGGLPSRLSTARSCCHGVPAGFPSFARRCQSTPRLPNSTNQPSSLHTLPSPKRLEHRAVSVYLLKLSLCLRSGPQTPRLCHWRSRFRHDLPLHFWRHRSPSCSTLRLRGNQVFQQPRNVISTVLVSLRRRVKEEWTDAN